MNVRDLNRNELIELKAQYYTAVLDQRGETPSYGEFATVDSLIDDAVIFDEYADIDFVEEDFFCNLRG